MPNLLKDSEIQRLVEEVSKTPQSRIFVSLADAYRQRGDYEKAILVAQEGLKHHPNFFGGKVALARAFFENGDLDPSRKIFENILRFSPDHILAHRILAQIYILQDEPSQALPLLQKLLDLDPEDLQTQEQIQEIKTRTPKQTPPSSSPPVETKTATLANLYRSQGHLQEALEIDERLHKIEPQNVGFQRPHPEFQNSISGLSKKEKLEQWLNRIQERRHSL